MAANRTEENVEINIWEKEAEIEKQQTRRNEQHAIWSKRARKLMKAMKRNEKRALTKQEKKKITTNHEAVMANKRKKSAINLITGLKKQIKLLQAELATIKKVTAYSAAATPARSASNKALDKLMEEDTQATERNASATMAGLATKTSQNNAAIADVTKRLATASAEVDKVSNLLARQRRGGRKTRRQNSKKRKHRTRRRRKRRHKKRRTRRH